jgi:hypothetical protein
MRQIFRFVVLIISILFSGHSYCQYSIKGKVIDSRTKEPLAFVNIVFNSDLHSGTTTDIDGKFYFNHSQKISSISCSYLGYSKVTIDEDSIGKENKGLLIELVPSTFTLHEVIIEAGENPVNRIIKKVIQNKEMNNPENISSFKYTSYNKSIYDFSPNDISGSDSLQIKLDKFLKGGHLLIMESVTERKYISKDINEEIITGARVSGFKHPSFAPLATDLQPFSFYNDIIKIFDVNYLNPVSDGSLNKYRFSIEDTLYQDKDTIFIISFKPLPSKNFEALKGVLYINTNKFAIQNVIAEPFDKGFIDIKIQQQYSFIAHKQWFPKQLNFEMTMRQYPSKNIGMRVNGKSYIDDVVLFPDLDKKDFPLESVSMHMQATDRDSAFWNNYRTEALSGKERITYRVIDSLGDKNKFEALLHLMEKIVQNKIPIKFIDLDISKTFVYNKFEGTRLGLGAYTNEKIFRFLSIGGFFGYGVKDHQWKYGGEFILTLNKNKEFELSGRHQNTLFDAGNSELNFLTQNQYDLRNYMAYRMDRIQQNSFSIGIRAFRYAKINLTLNHTLTNPQYEYEFQAGNQQIFTYYTTSVARLSLRYAFKEKLIGSLNQRVSIGTDYPVFYLTFSRGINNLFGSEFDFNKIETRIEKSFNTKNFGETRIRMDAGYVDKPLPYGLLFIEKGSYDKDLPFIVQNSFQTVRPYEFLSDRYVNFHFSHNFGSLLFQVKKFKPHIILHQDIGWGMLSNTWNHKMLDFKTEENGLYESGLQIDNIIKLNYLNIAYLGLGAGIFYRYGPTTEIEWKDNLAIKFSMSFTTK